MADQRRTMNAKAEPLHLRAALPWAAFLAMLVLALFHPGVLNDGDTFWHLATGKWILSRNAVPDVDPFSYSRGGAPWVCHEWLSDLLLAMAFRIAGWSGMVLLAAIAAATALFLFTRYMDRWFPPIGVLLLGVAALALTAPSLLVRPHILALPVLVAWMIGMLDARTAARSPAWRLLPLITVWSNLHGSYILGLAVAGVFALEALLASPSEWRTIIRRWGGFIAASAAAALINPNGIAGLTHPFSLMALDSLPFIGEWQPPDFSRVQPLEMVLIGGLYFLLSRGVRLPPVRLLLLLVVLHLALSHARHGILVCFVAMMAIAEPLAGTTEGNPPIGRQARLRWAAAALLAAACLAGLRLASPITRIDGPMTPISALTHVPRQLREQPVFNAYAFGGYLIHAGVRPFIDGRADMYGDAFLEQYDAATRQSGRALEETLQRYKVQWTILEPGTAAVERLSRMPGWCILYADRFAVVHVRARDSHCQAARSPDDLGRP